MFILRVLMGSREKTLKGIGDLAFAMFVWILPLQVRCYYYFTTANIFYAARWSFCISFYDSFKRGMFCAYLEFVRWVPPLPLLSGLLIVASLEVPFASPLFLFFFPSHLSLHIPLSRTRMLPPRWKRTRPLFFFWGGGITRNISRWTPNNSHFFLLRWLSGAFQLSCIDLLPTIPSYDLKLSRNT